ncbi:MAG: lysophospholipid acyltransferase family protein [candidate division KSB1 bacterium]|nr:lysophospholipid acyltransferase family protein [candidate division KSB1 bacterium]
MLTKRQKRELLRYLAGKIAWLIVLLWCRLGRIRIQNRRALDLALASGRPILYLVWHGRMILPLYVHRGQKIVAMVSEHGDGEVIARTTIRLGYRTVRGSSTRGGRKAFHDMLRHLKQGDHCTILPDGPQGPRMEMKPGAVMLAQRSGALVLPLTFAASRPIVFDSWDRFTLWKPFSRLLLLYGEPVTIPRTSTPEEFERERRRLEEAMNRLQEKADALV